MSKIAIKPEKTDKNVENSLKSRQKLRKTIKNFKNPEKNLKIIEKPS